MKVISNARECVKTHRIEKTAIVAVFKVLRGILTQAVFKCLQSPFIGQPQYKQNAAYVRIHAVKLHFTRT
jgi:hypothetical protein